MFYLENNSEKNAIIKMKYLPDLKTQMWLGFNATVQLDTTQPCKHFILFF